QRFHFAVRTHAGQAPVIALAHDQTALQVEGSPVPADGVPDEFRRLSGRHAKQFVLAEIDKIPIACRMPGWAFSEGKARSRTLCFGGLEHFGQIIGCGHWGSSRQHDGPSSSRPIELPFSTPSNTATEIRL